MKYSLPKTIANIISIINKSGFKAHIVGGCVRDILLNKTPADWDITTNASPGTIKSLFRKALDTGIKHGTVTVVYKGMPVEVTTWRKETGYSDHRHPDSICLTDSLIEDLARRDFTMNAIAYHPEEGLVDPFGGYADISGKIIRCVGNPYERFSEDALRMLRAIRFSAQLDFDIDKNTFAAMIQHSRDLTHISRERIQAEINKILESNYPQKLSLLWDSGISTIVFPGIETLPAIWYKAAKHFTGSQYQKVILFSLLFYISCKTDAIHSAKNYLTINKYDNKTTNSILRHIKCLNDLNLLTQRNIRKAATEYGVSITENTVKILNALQSINEKKPVLSHEKNNILPVIPSISGGNLKILGLQGRAIKDVLDTILLCLYEDPALNRRDILICLAKSIMASEFYTGK
ncbi:MAG: CCA tRNA nucleotidyltransferase [Acetivibrionales bacterium]|jgi:tRNA nucleotidyltransferase (CCA-adding enzyme)